MSNAKLNKKFLQVAPKATIDSVLNSIAKHYGTTVADIKDELTHEDAESILDYIPESGMRRAVSVLMQKHSIRAEYKGNNMNYVNAKSRLVATKTTGDVTDLNNVLHATLTTALKTLLKAYKRFGIKPPRNTSITDLSEMVSTLDGVQFILTMIESIAGEGDKKVKVDKMIQVVDGSFVISTNSDYAAASVQRSLSNGGLRYGYSVTVDGSVVRVKMN